jgi:serine/threonine protein kinase
MPSPPITPRGPVSRSASAASLLCEAQVAANQGTFAQSPLARGSESALDCLEEFAMDELKLGPVLGKGRSTVRLAVFDAHETVAVKLNDVVKMHERVPEILNEVCAYDRLSHLQGTSIPRLLFHGLIEEVLYCIGLSLCGAVPETLTAGQKQMLLHGLDEIHKAGLLHNDIKVDNILVDEHGVARLIDFGFASLSSEPADHAKERNQLLECIEAL